MGLRGKNWEMGYVGCEVWTTGLWFLQSFSYL